MAFWKRKQAPAFEQPAESSLGGANAKEAPARGVVLDRFEPAAFDPNLGLPPQVPAAPETISEPLFVAPVGSENASAASERSRVVSKAAVDPRTIAAESPAAVQASDASSSQEPRDNVSGSSAAARPTSFREAPSRVSGLIRSRQKDAPGYLADWQRGLKGRPSQVFIGFLPDVTRKDAIAFALGVAQRHCTNLVNSAYAVYKHNTGFAYEVHEGGPRRGYLPEVLKRFDEQSGGPITEDSAAVIETAQRRVRVERSQVGLTAFLMPESFQGAQSEWLKPGPKLKPVVPVRAWLVWFGAAVFFAGFLTLITTLATRPEPLPLNASPRVAVPYEALPISQWPNLLALYGRGEVISALRWEHGKWAIDTAKAAGKRAPSSSLPPGRN